MKTVHYIFLFFAFALTGCEEVIDVNLDTAAPRLVIDASIKWTKGTDGNEQKIKLTTTTGYYDTEIPKVSNATVFITDTNNTTFTFTETPGTGEYICTTFEPVIGAEYELTITYNGQTYNAKETMRPVPPIDKIEQEQKDGFEGKYYQVKAFYTDDMETADFYLFRFKPSFKAVPSYQVSEDKFYQGKQIFGLYLSEDFKVGDNIDITIYGISQRYYNYMNKLITISQSGGPFQSPPTTVRGNVVNTTDSENYALGYFNLCEVDSRNYVIQ